MKRVIRDGVAALGSGLALLGLPEVSRAHHTGADTGGAWDWLSFLGVVLVLIPVVIWAVSASRDRRKPAQPEKDQSPRK
jgi:hypothetical protein